jgi:hypothetical protein
MDAARIAHLRRRAVAAITADVAAPFGHRAIRHCLSVDDGAVMTMAQ